MSPGPLTGFSSFRVIILSCSIIPKITRDTSNSSRGTTGKFSNTFTPKQWKFDSFALIGYFPSKKAQAFARDFV
jgi:hypothetical protein